MTAHVFVVDNDTFKLHLEHQFAGIGAGEDKFTLIQHPKEINSRLRVMSQLACDITRIAEGDSIFFYLQGKPGLFHGEFQAVGRPYGVDNGEKINSLSVSKNLPLRISIAARKVYEAGVPEDMFLDRLTDPKSGQLLEPNRVPWTLIYRKLLGKRGCVAIRDDEADLLRSYLKSQNSGSPTKSNNLTLDSERNVVERHHPKSTTTSDDASRHDIDLRPIYDLARLGHRRLELFLQWMLISDLTLNRPSIAPLLSGDRVTWIGNEVGCGVGSRRIDLLLEVSGSSNGSRRIIVVELKDDLPKPESENQLRKYVEWVLDHYLMDSRYESVEPILITTKKARAVGRNPAWTAGTVKPLFRGSFDHSSKVRPIRHLVVDNSHIGTIGFIS